jgi:hypothetical protein
VPDGIAEQFAHYQDSVAHDAVEYPGRHQLGRQPPTGDRNTRRRARQENGARYSHLPGAAPGVCGARPFAALRCRGNAPHLLTETAGAAAKAQLSDRSPLHATGPGHPCLARAVCRPIKERLGCQDTNQPAQASRQASALVGRQRRQNPDLA